MAYISSVKKKSEPGNWLIYQDTNTLRLTLWDDPNNEFSTGEDPIYCNDINRYPFLKDTIGSDTNLPAHFRSLLQVLLWLSTNGQIEESVLTNLKDSVKIIQ